MSHRVHRCFSRPNGPPSPVPATTNRASNGCPGSSTRPSTPRGLPATLKKSKTRNRKGSGNSNCEPDMGLTPVAARRNQPISRIGRQKMSSPANSKHSSNKDTSNLSLFVRSSTEQTTFLSRAHLVTSSEMQSGQADLPKLSCYLAREYLLTHCFPSLRAAFAAHSIPSGQPGTWNSARAKWACGPTSAQSRPAARAYLPQLRFHERRLIMSTQRTPTRLRRPTETRQGWSAAPRVSRYVGLGRGRWLICL